MSASTLRVRRATVEDLDTLRPLWASMRLPVEELEPRLTEFQIVENGEGVVMGGIGLQLGERQGRLHSEGFTDFGVADAARELLWKRIQTLASNHGILRLWMHESIPFWSGTGFKPADAESLKRLPGGWNAGNARWFTLQLKDEEVIANFEKELTMFMAAERQHTARISDRARLMIKAVTIFAVMVAIATMGAAIYLLIKKPELLHLSK